MLILDEAHERSLNIDSCSATLYPVDIRYAPAASNDDVDLIEGR